MKHVVLFQLAVSLDSRPGNGLFHIIVASMYELSANRSTLVPVNTFHELCHNGTVDFK